MTSANASIALEPLSLESSALREAPHLDGRAEGAWNRQADDDDFKTRPRPGPGPAAEGRAQLTGRPGPGYGLCTACGQWQVVKGIGGTLGRHNSDIRGGWSWCPGSRKRPAEPVPCTRCGRTGVALVAGYSGLCADCRRTRAAEGTP